MEFNEISLQIIKQKLEGKPRALIEERLSKIFGVHITEMHRNIFEFEQSGDLFCDKKGRLYISKKIGLVKGTINGNSKGYAFLVPEDENSEDIFIPAHNLNGALHSDKVLALVKTDKDGRSEGAVEKVLEHSLKTLVGTIKVFQKFSFVEPDNKKISKDVFIKKGAEKNAKSGDKVFVRLTGYDGRNLEGSVIEILGKDNGNVTTDVLSIIRGYELIENFSSKLLEECKKIPQSVDATQYPDRLDLRNEIIFTIDGDDTKDYDDAVSLKMDGENYILGVHIADVGEYVKRDSLLDEEAFERGTSSYFPNCVLPMLPKELSNGICSLNPNEDRLTLSCICKISPEGKILSHLITESVICSNYRMTYRNVTKIINGDKELCAKYKDIVPTLKLMAELNDVLEKVRLKRGEINFEIPEAQIELDPKTLEVISLQKRPRTVSERLIESFMLVANEVVAEHFQKLGVPFVYRIHETPDDDRITAFNEFSAALGYKLKASGEELKPIDIQQFMESIRDDETRQIINGVLLRSMKKAKYSNNCIGHFGLAAKYYCHFTSPIRRYPDLTIHRIIKDYLHKKLDEKSLRELKQFVVKSSEQSSVREVLTQKAERDVDDYFKCRYMQKMVGTEFDATICSVTNFGFFVELDNTVEGLVSIASLGGYNYQFNDKSLTLSNGIKRYRIGDKVKVKLLNVNLAERNIDFVLVQK
ncbi:MAG TPA: ribonuclease R [Clostridiales bacterium]|nr:ribonuclease R [Clostridiales bacterium]